MSTYGDEDVLRGCIVQYQRHHPYRMKRIGITDFGLTADGYTIEEKPKGALFYPNGFRFELAMLKVIISLEYSTVWNEPMVILRQVRAINGKTLYINHTDNGWCTLVDEAVNAYPPWSNKGIHVDFTFEASAIQKKIYETLGRRLIQCIKNRFTSTKPYSFEKDATIQFLHRFILLAPHFHEAAERVLDLITNLPETRPETQEEKRPRIDDVRDVDDDLINQVVVCDTLCTLLEHGIQQRQMEVEEMIDKFDIYQT